MNRLLSALADESVLLLGLVAAGLAAGNASEATTKVVTAAVPLVLALLVRMVTSSPTTVVKVARDTAESLSGDSAGVVGVVTGEAEKIIDSVVAGVGGLASRLAPKAEEVGK